MSYLLGAAVFAVCLAAFVTVLIAYPKQTIGCVVALVVLIAIAIVVIVDHEKRLSAEQQERMAKLRERESGVTVTLRHAAALCTESQPLAVSVTNTTPETLAAVDIRIEAYRPGYSTDLLEHAYGENSIKWDKIVPSGQSATLCYPLPSTLVGMRDPASPSLDYRVGHKSSVFR